MDSHEISSGADTFIRRDALVKEDARINLLPKWSSRKCLIDSLATPSTIKPMYVLKFSLRVETASFRVAFNHLGHKAYGIAEAGKTNYWKEAIDAKFHSKGKP